MVPVVTHNNQPIIESHHGSQVIISGQRRVNRVHRYAYARLFIVKLVDKNRNVIPTGGEDLLPPLWTPPPPILVRLTLNRVARNLDISQVGGLILIKVSFAGYVKPMLGEEFVQFLTDEALICSSLVARIYHRLAPVKFT